MTNQEELLLKKQTLIEQIIKHPLDFTDAQFLELVQIGQEEEDHKKEVELNFDDLRKMIIRIFDINETTLKEESDATKGVLGFLNKRSTDIRQKRYYQLIDEGFRNLHEEGKKVIVAEGDSWFQFPVFIKDIVDWLSDVPQYAVYSIAYGGDWFTNILYDEKYIEELSIHRPEVFMISGGGNDFVGSNRIAVMVEGEGKCNQRQYSQVHEQILDLEGPNRQALKDDIEEGYQYILPSFYSFLWTIKAQYWKLFKRLQESGKFDGMKIITQGYDYAIPTFEKRTKKWYHLQPIVNKFVGSGHWLKRPLMVQGIQEDTVGKHIIKAMIFEINCLFIDLVQNFDFKNVYHIDCRGTAKGPEDWWDEIHLHSEGFEKIAKAYQYCIDHNLTQKVIRVVNFEKGKEEEWEGGLKPAVF